MKRHQAPSLSDTENFCCPGLHLNPHSSPGQLPSQQQPTSQDEKSPLDAVSDAALAPQYATGDFFPEAISPTGKYSTSIMNVNAPPFDSPNFGVSHQAMPNPYALTTVEQPVSQMASYGFFSVSNHLSSEAEEYLKHIIDVASKQKDLQSSQVKLLAFEV